MLDKVDFDQARTIVELGAGTGCFTKEIINRLHPDAELYTFEINEKFCGVLNTYSDERVHVINDSAENMSKYVQSADVVISGMPLASLPKQVTKNILADATKVLKEDGVYLQYQYSPLSKRKLVEYFGNVNLSFEPLNIPPAVVYSCKKKKRK